MLIAIPIFGVRVAPRFDCAETFLLAEKTGNEVGNLKQIDITGIPLRQRVRYLQGLGVSLLVCGSIEKTLTDEFVRNGVEVVSWITGEWEDVLSALKKGALESGIQVCSCGKRRRIRGCRGKNVG